MRLLSLTTLLAALACTARAELKLPAIIGDNMVLQQKQPAEGEAKSSPLSFGPLSVC